MAEVQNGLVLGYQGLFFDLSGMHSANLLTRVRAALLLGFDRAVSGPHLRQVLETLAAMSPRQPVRFFTNAQEWRPGTRTPAYPAMTTWSSTGDKQPASVAEIRATRSAVRVFMQDLGDTFAGTLETTWHELLHPTVPFTHPQDGLPPEIIVDYPRWIEAVYGLKSDMPNWVVDPVTNARQSTDYTWSLNKPYCISCNELG